MFLKQLRSKQMKFSKEQYWKRNVGSTYLLENIEKGREETE